MKFSNEPPLDVLVQILMNFINVDCTFDQSFKEAWQALQVSNSIGVKLGDRFWSPPQEGVFRLGVNASVNYDAQLFGIGAVVRDCQGKIRAALAIQTICPSSVVEAKINVVLYGVVYFHSWSIQILF
ncbi:hypothetical protein C2S51_001990 [Perilla frutescens var. frutescens]|nr:hypothetical protein C2S51_001990 [Perilla frutescens var. frutescens]